MSSKKNLDLTRFGEFLRRTRKQQGISQEQLALRAEINRTYMGEVERGEENISLLTIQKIDVVLKVRASAIIEKAGL